MTDTTKTTPAKRPAVKLIGQDGNAFNLIGLCMRAARRAGMPAAEQAEVQAYLTSAGSYDELLGRMMERFDVS